MKFEFKLPDIGEGIHEAELLQWSVQPGQRIKEGQDVAVMNTDKVAVDLPSPRSGTVVSLHGAVGDVITVGTVIMVLEMQDASAAAVAAAAHPGPAAAADSAVPSAPGPVSGEANKSEEGYFAAGPSVRRLARELGVSLAQVAGSGPRGRILRADVEAAGRLAPVAASAPATPEPVTARTPARTPARMPEHTPGRTLRRERLAGARLTSARNLHGSVQRSVTTTTTFEVPGDGLLRLQSVLAPQAQLHDLKLSPLHLIAKCVAAALVRHERVNATIDEDTQELLLRESADLGIAVAAADRLVVPVVYGADQRLLFDLVRTMDDQARRAREGQLLLSELSGGSFTVSSTGGMERATMLSTRPIINPPQTATLWVSRIVDRPRVIQGLLSAGPMLTASLSFDHRFIDGAEAVRFINDLADLLEHPERALG
jgi:pyruvate dehydrogenase E2 component (dihydrolipoamide acetyltransferase)